MKSIQKKLVGVLIVIVSSTLLISCLVSSILNYANTTALMKKSLSEAVSIASDRVTVELEGYKKLMNELATNPIYHDQTIPLATKRIFCSEVAQRNGFTTFSYTNVKGVAFGGSSLSSKDFFQQCRDTMKTYMSDPVIRIEDGSIIVMIAAPMVVDDNFAGIVYAGIDSKFLSTIIADIKVGDTGNAIMIDKNGATIGHNNIELVLNQYNTQVELENNPSLKKLAEIEQKMMAGEEGTGSCTQDGKSKFVAYKTIEGTNGWSIAVSVDNMEFMKNAYISIFVTIVLGIVFVVCSILFVSKITKNITNPINLCIARLQMLAEGDLKSEMPTINTNDETKLLANATEKTIGDMNNMISDITKHLKYMADGMFNSNVTGEYIGDFLPIKQSIQQILLSLNDTLIKINEVSKRVANGSDQLSQGSQGLAEGATDQASSIEELTATLIDVSEKINKNSENAANANTSVIEVAKEIEIGNRYMQDMLGAMHDISNNSKKIEQIIKSIEDIASQTNLLALNAAIEAARAGEAGRGFAVVANEIGNLAAQSAVAVKTTGELIDNSVLTVKNGMEIANATAEALNNIVIKIELVKSNTNEITVASDEQKDAINQLTQGIEEISAVVQTNSATAQESAASSQELHEESEALRNLISKFELLN